MLVRIRDARYAGCIYSEQEALPEIAVAGRSNVGKSSLINALLNRKSLVQTSKTPGKTRNINYFRVELVDRPSLYLVDMPGYGYARVSQDMRGEWGRIAQRYFSGNQQLRLLLLLVDIRRDIRAEERLALDLVRHTAARAVVVATKADKVGTGERRTCAEALHAATGIDPIITSAEKRWGIDAIWQAVLDVLPDLP